MSGGIEVKNLSYAYTEGTQAISDLSFSVGAGECVALVGANGAGKSTLLLLLSGLLDPSNGSIVVDGLELNKKNLPAIRNQLGLVFLDPDDQLFTPRVYDDVAFGPMNQGLSGLALQERVERALAITHTSHLAERAPFRLSSGEKRMAALAAVLAMDVRILVMDEPSASLDARGRRNFINLMAALPHTRLIVSHDLPLCAEMCQRVIVLDQGRIVADGDAADILNSQELLFRYGLLA